MFFLVLGKKEGQVEEIDGDSYKYYLLAGTTRPYPDDTFYSVGRVPRNCCTNDFFLNLLALNNLKLNKDSLKSH